MRRLLPIMHRDRLAAVVLRDRAIIASDLSTADRRTVEAMCLYAAEILNDENAMPYTDEAALAYADAIAARRLANP